MKTCVEHGTTWAAGCMACDASRPKIFGCCVDKKYGKGCTDATCMKLPEGKTCGSCVLFPRCKAFGIATAERTDCDFFPRKYRADEQLAELRLDMRKVYTAGPPPDGRSVEAHLDELLDPMMTPPPHAIDCAWQDGGECNCNYEGHQ